MTDVVLGYDTLEGYMKNGCFFGACIGRSGNRIEGGRFKLDGQEVILAQNEGNNNLHSGPDGFEKKLWTAKHIDQENNSVTFPGLVRMEKTDSPENSISVLHMNLQKRMLCVLFTPVCAIRRRLRI